MKILTVMKTPVHVGGDLQSGLITNRVLLKDHNAVGDDVFLERCFV